MNSSSNSFSILVPFASVNRKPKAQPSSPARPLSSIIAQNQIRQQNLQYQHLLIRRKQLEISSEDARNQYQALIKRRKKANRTLEEAVARRDQAHRDVRDKRCYLQKYYEELDRKFRGNREDLFASLARLEKSLLEAYEKDQRRLRESLAGQEEEFSRLVTLVGVERERRDRLHEQLQRMEAARDGERGHGKAGDQLAELRSENAQLRGTFDQLTREKKRLQGEERILKRVQNVEEEHRRHSMVIQNGIKKMFMNKLKDQRYKAAVSPEYFKNLQGLKEILAKKRQEKDTLQSEIGEKRSKLAIITREIAERNREYGELQEKLMRRQSG